VTSPAPASGEPDRTGPAGGYRPWELLARTFAVDHKTENDLKEER
jgi:hypothetical protein